MTRGQAIARGAAAGFFGNSAGQVATGGFGNYSPVQAVTQGVVGAASGGLGHAAGFASATSSFRLTGNAARALRLGAGTGTTVATATGATVNLGLSNNVGGLNGSNSSCGCTAP